MPSCVSVEAAISTSWHDLAVHFLEHSNRWFCDLELCTRLICMPFRQLCDVIEGANATTRSFGLVIERVVRMACDGPNLHNPTCTELRLPLHKTSPNVSGRKSAIPAQLTRQQGNGTLLLDLYSPEISRWGHAVAWEKHHKPEKGSVISISELYRPCDSAEDDLWHSASNDAITSASFKLGLDAHM